MGEALIWIVFAVLGTLLVVLGIAFVACIVGLMKVAYEELVFDGREW